MQRIGLPCASSMSLGLCRSVDPACSPSSGALLAPPSPPVAPVRPSVCINSSDLGSLSRSSTSLLRPISFARSRSLSGVKVMAGIAQQEYANKAKYEQDAKVIQVHTVKQFDDALVAAKNKLVVVEYAASHSPNSRKIYPAMVELSLTCQDAVFLLVMGDESNETQELCKRVNIDKVPHFVFYKNREIIHEEEGIGPDELLGDVLYYGDPDAPILQLHSKQEFEDLIQKHKEDGKLLVVDVGLKHCGPCVKIYPTFVKLAKKLRETAVFARINGDETEELMELLKEMDVVEVPTFLFLLDGTPRGRYVGSGKGELIGEILRHQGVRVTY